jgi:acetamidase/formamidase
VQLRIDLVRAAHATGPAYTHQPVAATGEWTATTGIGPDLFTAAREATRRAVDLISARTGIAPIDAYLALSLAGELRVSEIVDAPNWVVSMHIPPSLLPDATHS